MSMWGGSSFLLVACLIAGTRAVGNPAWAAQPPEQDQQGSGSLLWQVDFDRALLPPVVAGDAVYAASPGLEEGFLVALDAASGRKRWRFGEDWTFASPPLVVDGVAYAVDAAVDMGYSDGLLLALDAATGTESTTCRRRPPRRSPGRWSGRSTTPSSGAPSPSWARR